VRFGSVYQMITDAVRLLVVLPAEMRQAIRIRVLIAHCSVECQSKDSRESMTDRATAGIEPQRTMIRRNVTFNGVYNETCKCLLNVYKQFGCQYNKAQMVLSHDSSN